MRPRHKAAENGAVHRALHVVGGASMRPRHKAAENVVLDAHVLAREQASMRPRHKAAENACGSHILGDPPHVLQ